MRLGRSARDAREQGPRSGRPIGRAQPRKRWDKIDAVRRRNARRQKFALRRRGDHAQPVAQPLHAAARMEHAALERIHRLSAHGIADGREQPARRGDAPFSRIEQQKQPRAVGDLARSRGKTRLPDERRLLIARQPRKRDGTAPEHHFPHARVARAHLGQDVRRGRKAVEKRRIPGKIADIEEHRAGGVGHVRDKGLALRELPDEVAIHRSRAQPARPKRRLRRRDMIERPADLARRKIGVGHKPRARVDEFLCVLVQRLAPCRRTPTLPADRRTYRVTRNAVPQDDRLALVGDADARELVARKARAGIEDVRRFEVDLVGVLLHPAGVRKALSHLLLRAKDKFLFA